MIQVEHLSKSFGAISAVSDLTFEIKQGEILGLLGPNGAGKTTTMRMLAGFFPPSSGSIRMDGIDLFRAPKTIRRAIGYLPENAPLYDDMTTEDFLRWAAHMKGFDGSEQRRVLAQATEQCGIDSIRRRFIRRLSRGFRQRVALAQALIGDPKLLILDEPTNGLDPKQIMEIRTLIKALSEDKTVILSTHILPEVGELSNRVLIIHEGKFVASGSPEDLALKLRHSSELIMRVRGKIERLEATFKQLDGILAVRIEQSRGEEHEYRILYRKETDLRPVISRHVIACGLELLSLRESPLSLEDIFMKLVVDEFPGGHL